MNYLWLATLIVAAVATWVGLGVALPLMLWWEHERPVIAAALALVVNVLALALLLSVSMDDDDGVHRWRGGAGPETVCEYEERTIVVGKVPTAVTETVCRDPR